MDPGGTSARPDAPSTARPRERPGLGLDLPRVRLALDAPEIRAFGGPVLAMIRAALEVGPLRGHDGDTLVTSAGRRLARRLPHGSLVLDHPLLDDRARRARVVELDPDGHVVAVVQRAATGAFQGVRVYQPGVSTMSVLPGGAQHPLWGASDRLLSLTPGTEPALLTVCEAVAWDAIAAIPALADPTRLPPGAGTAVLNLLAGLAGDQGSGPLAYRGPYPTEQLFWALVESFRFEGGQGVPVASFTSDAEATFRDGRDGRDGRAHVAPVRWIPAPHERRLIAPGLVVLLRDGVDKLVWEGRAYRRSEVQGLGRREHRVLRWVTGPSPGDEGPRLVASLWALDRPLEDHFILNEAGNVVAGPLAREDEPVEDVPLAAPWRAALARLLPLEATPLLAGAIAATWPGLHLVWGPVPHDLVAVEGETLRLSWRLCRAYSAAWASVAPSQRRALGRVFVRDVLGLLGDPVRRAAASWMAALPLGAQEAELAAAAAVDRADAAARALKPLDELLTALEAGEAAPVPPRVSRTAAGHATGHGGRRP